MRARLSSIDLRDGEYLVQPYSQTVAGFWILDREPVRLPQSAGARQLGQAIRDALEISRQAVEVPPVEEDTAKPLLDMLGIPDYATYAKNTRSIGVRSTIVDDKEAIKVTPKRNEGTSRGFTPIKDRAVTFNYDSPAQLGEAVIRAFEDAM